MILSTDCIWFHALIDFGVFWKGGMGGGVMMETKPGNVLRTLPWQSISYDFHFY